MDVDGILLAIFQKIDANLQQMEARFDEIQQTMRGSQSQPLMQIPDDIATEKEFQAPVECLQDDSENLVKMADIVIAQEPELEPLANPRDQDRGVLEASPKALNWEINLTKTDRSFSIDYELNGNTSSLNLECSEFGDYNGVRKYERHFRSCGNFDAQQVFEKMPLSRFSGSDCFAHISSAHYQLGNWVFDPGDFVDSRIANRTSFAVDFENDFRVEETGTDSSKVVVSQDEDEDLSSVIDVILNKNRLWTVNLVFDPGISVTPNNDISGKMADVFDPTSIEFLQEPLKVNSDSLEVEVPVVASDKMGAFDVSVESTEVCLGDFRVDSLDLLAEKSMETLAISIFNPGIYKAETVRRVVVHKFSDRLHEFGAMFDFDPGGICLHQFGSTLTIMDDARQLSHYLLLEEGCSEGLFLIRSIWIIAWSLLVQRLVFDPGGVFAWFATGLLGFLFPNRIVLLLLTDESLLSHQQHVLQQLLREFTGVEQNGLLWLIFLSWLRQGIVTTILVIFFG